MLSTGSASTRKTEAAGSAGAWSDSPRRWPDRAGGAARAGSWPTFARYPDCLPGLWLAARSGLLVLLSVVLIGLCAALACWSGGGTPNPAENNLHADLSSSNLDNTSAQAPSRPTGMAQPEKTNRRHTGSREFAVAPSRVSAVKPPETVLPVNRQVPAPFLPFPNTPTTEGPPLLPVETPRLFDAGNLTAMAPVIEEPGFLDELLATRNSHRGDSTMMRNWKLFGMPTVLAAALAAPAGPVAAQVDGPSYLAQKGGEPADQHPDEKSIKDIVKQLDDLQKSINDLKATTNQSLDDVKELKNSLGKSVEEIKKDVNELHNSHLQTNLTVGTAQKDIKDLKDQIAQIQKDIQDLRRRPVSDTVSAYAPPPAATTGRVRLVNTYFERMTIIVNGKSYDLEPGETRLTEPLPAGSFTYEVLGVTPARTRTLTANDTFTIDVHPRA